LPAGGVELGKISINWIYMDGRSPMLIDIDIDCLKGDSCSESVYLICHEGDIRA
jgi:hypothetical protein